MSQPTPGSFSNIYSASSLTKINSSDTSLTESRQKSNPLLSAAPASLKPTSTIPCLQIVHARTASAPSSPVKQQIDIPDSGGLKSAKIRLAALSNQSLKKSAESIPSVRSSSRSIDGDVIPKNVVANTALQFSKLADSPERTYSYKALQPKEMKNAIERSQTINVAANTTESNANSIVAFKETKNELKSEPDESNTKTDASGMALKTDYTTSSTPIVAEPEAIIDTPSINSPAVVERLSIAEKRLAKTASPNASLRISTNVGSSASRNLVKKPSLIVEAESPIIPLSPIEGSPAPSASQLQEQSSAIRTQSVKDKKNERKHSRLGWEESLPKQLANASLSKLLQEGPTDFSESNEGIPHSDSQNSLSSPMFQDLKQKRASAILDTNSPWADLSPINSAQKKKKEDIMGGACSSLGGTPRTLEILQALYVKACEEARVLLAAITRKIEEGSGSNDSITLLFGYFFNTCRRMSEICASIIPVVELKGRIMEISRLQRQFRSDESRDAKVYVHSASNILISD